MFFGREYIGALDVLLYKVHYCHMMVCHESSKYSQNKILSGAFQVFASRNLWLSYTLICYILGYNRIQTLRIHLHMYHYVLDNNLLHMVFGLAQIRLQDRV